ncbi:hypothetical protein FRC12_003040 [Ceratobasidium sp. 428]|nr:hypothetical protein FRC12_003040 [Ceratobasidium sp. 428]
MEINPSTLLSRQALTGYANSEYKMDPEQGVRQDFRDIQDLRDTQKTRKQVTVEGYRTLGILSTFTAGVEAQCLSLTPDNADPTDPTIQAIHAFLFIGLLLSSFGAVTSLLAARWFDLLVKPSELELLSHQWECSWQSAAGGIVTELVKEKVKITDPDSEFQYSPLEGAGPSNAIKEQVRRCKLNTRNWLLAKAIFLPLNMIVLGFASFIVGILIYIWEFESHITATACSIVTLLSTGVIVCLLLDFETIGALNFMNFSRVRL